MPPRPIPEGYHSVTPYLIVDGAARAIEFYKQAFGATVGVRMDGPDGKVGHAELKIGDSHVMLADENPQMGARGPKTSIRPEPGRPSSRRWATSSHDGAPSTPARAGPG